MHALRFHGLRLCLHACGIAALLIFVAPAARAADTPLPIERLVPQITAQVVQVVAHSGNGDGAHYGSAVLADGGRAVTSCHVIGTATELYVVVGVELHRAKLLAADRFHDLCVLALPADVSRAAPLCRASPQVAVGEQSYAVGFASGRLGFSRGKLQARYPLDGGFVLRTGAGFLPGASGGGLFDDSGRLIGVLTFLRRGGATPAYLAVPCEWLAALLVRTDSSAALDERAATRQDADPVPFWQLLDQGSAAAPWFMQALRLEAEERWSELEALARRRHTDAPDDEAAAAMGALARRQLGAAAPEQEPAAQEPAMAMDRPARLIEQDDATCQSNGGRLVSLQRSAASTDARALRVWVERWHLGVRTADRTRHDLRAAGLALPLGCSCTIDGPQHWEIAAFSYVEP